MKAKNPIVLILKRADETKEYTINFFNMKDLLKASPKIKKFMSQGWKLIDVRGKGKIVNFFREQIEQEKQGNYKIPIRKTISLGWESSQYKEKVSIKRVKDFLRRKR